MTALEEAAGSTSGSVALLAVSLTRGAAMLMLLLVSKRVLALSELEELVLVLLLLPPLLLSEPAAAPAGIALRFIPPEALPLLALAAVGCIAVIGSARLGLVRAVW